jgi:hypothetical protein
VLCYGGNIHIHGVFGNPMTGKDLLRGYWILVPAKQSFLTPN